MAEAGEGTETPGRKRDKIEQFLQKTYQKGELSFKHAIGLGAGQNVVPVSEPNTNDAPRTVEVGWHPVGGFAGKWFAEKTGLGKMIKEKVNKYPDPTQHWAVLVGEYAHQLWMDENFDVIYTNAKVDPKEWQTFTVGETRFNDDALRRAGEAVIQHIRSVRPGYNLITNNCQTYVTQLLDVVQVSHVKQFATTLAVYERLFGSGKVADLFPDMEVNAQGQGQIAPAAPTGEEQELGVVGGSGQQGHVAYQNPQEMVHQEPGSSSAGQTSVSLAQQVMNDNTHQVDTDEMSSRHMDDEGNRNHHVEGWSKKTSSFFRKLKR